MIMINMLNLTDIKLLNQCNRWLMVHSLRQPMLSEESVLSLALHLLYANRSAHSRTSNQNNLSFLAQPQSLSLEYCFNTVSIVWLVWLLISHQILPTSLPPHFCSSLYLWIINYPNARKAQRKVIRWDTIKSPKIPSIEYLNHNLTFWYDR